MNQNPPSTDDALELGDSSSFNLGTSPGAKKLKNFLKAMNDSGIDADMNYRLALKKMKKEPKYVISAISEAIGRCEPQMYSLRWSLVYAACQLRHMESLSFLRNCVLTPIPPEESKNSHSFSTVGQETILRTTAIEGIGYLAKRGNKDALQALFDFLSIPSVSIRRASAQAILKSDKSLKKKVADCLPKDLRFLVDIEAKSVHDIPQVKDPRTHLKEKRLRTQKKPTPPGLSDTGVYKKSKKRGGPKIGD